METIGQHVLDSLYNGTRGSSALRGRVVAFGGQYYLFVCTALVATLFFTAPRVSAQDVSPVGTVPSVSTVQETNDRIHSLGTTAAKNAPHDYIIGNGDLVTVAVFDVPELSHDLRVSQSGSISIPLVPTRVHIAGLTESQAEQVIADILQSNGLVSHPEVNVLVKEHKSKPITVVGAVGHPMIYEADHTVTLLEVLAEAGGVSNDAGDTVIITRARPSFVLIPNPNPEPSPSAPPGAAPTADSLAPDPPPSSAANPSDAKSPQNSSAFPSATELAQNPAPPATSLAPSSDATTASSPSGNIITINLRDLLETGDTRNNILLQAGDVVTVPHAGIVYVLGAVNRAGGFVLSNDRSQMTTLKIMALCGGATKTAKLDRAVIIRKDEQGKQTETEVDLKKILHQETEDLPMRASDILYVPDSHTKQVMYQGLTIAAAVASAVAIYRVAGY
jgi:protein involved in polysaccharide export with SLBB domain